MPETPCPLLSARTGVVRRHVAVPNALRERYVSIVNPTHPGCGPDARRASRRCETAATTVAIQHEHTANGDKKHTFLCRCSRHISINNHSVHPSSATHALARAPILNCPATHGLTTWTPDSANPFTEASRRSPHQKKHQYLTCVKRGKTNFNRMLVDKFEGAPILELLRERTPTQRNLTSATATSSTRWRMPRSRADATTC